MRPINKSYTPAAANATGIATGLTGAGPFTTFTANGAGDNMGHQLSFTSAANLSGINLTVVGVDADGNPRTETLAGPNANTVNSVRDYLTITSITASSTLGANTMNVGWTAVAVSQMFILDQRSGIGARFGLQVTGTINYTVQETWHPVFLPQPPWGTYQENLPWANDANLTNQTATANAQLPPEMTAARIVVNSVTAGATIDAWVNQYAEWGS